jgi:hypothetical protein
VIAGGDCRFLGWSGIEVRIGAAALALDWQPGDIRNCSYAPGRRWVGISAEDRTRGGQVLAIHDLATGASRVLLRADVVLRHALDAGGTRACCTVPSARKSGCDLMVLETDTGTATRVPEAEVAHGCTPAWYPDSERIAICSPAGNIEVVDIAQGRREVVAQGVAPAVHPDGRRIAFRRGNDVLLLDLAARTTKALGVRRGWLGQSLAGSLSWSPNGSRLAFGVTAGLVGKSVAFHLLDPATRRQQAIDAPYLRDLILIP